MKRMLVLVSAVVILGLTGFAGSAAATGPRPTPATGYCGALNMLASDAMAGYFADPPTGPMSVNNPNGNEGMSTAVAASDCS